MVWSKQEAGEKRDDKGRLKRYLEVREEEETGGSWSSKGKSQRGAGMEQMLYRQRGDFI